MVVAPQTLCSPRAQRSQGQMVWTAKTLDDRGREGQGRKGRGIGGGREGEGERERKGRGEGQGVHGEHWLCLPTAAWCSLEGS